MKPERCTTGKKKYGQKRAKKNAKYLKYHKKIPGMIPMAYRCDVCHWWHVGNSA